MVMGRGRGFESRRRILDGQNIFSHIFVVRIIMFFKKTKINEKVAENGPFLKKQIKSLHSYALLTYDNDIRSKS